MPDATTSSDTEGALKDFDYAIKDEDIERARLAIGHDIPQGPVSTTARQPVTGSATSRASYGDDNPLFADLAYGKHTRWGARSRHR